MRNPLLNKWVILTFLLLSTLAGGGYGLYEYVNERLAQMEKANTPQQTAVGAVAQQKGRVWSELNSSKRQLAVGSPIYQGDRIITGRHARLILKMSDESIIAIGEDTELVVQDYQYIPPEKLAQTQPGAPPPPPNRGLLELTKGFMKATTGALAKMDGRPFTVNTPVATMGVRGTEFWGRLHYEKNENTGEEFPRLSHICMNPVCTVKNDSGEQVSEKSNLSIQVESKRKSPTTPEPANREMLARAYLSTLVPPKLSPDMVQALSAKMAALYQEKGLANSPEAAARMVEASLERMVEKVEWDGAEKAVMKLLDDKGKVTPEEVDARMKQELSAADYEKFKQLEKDKEAALSSLQQELERRLQDELSVDKAKEVNKILEDQKQAQEELKKTVQERMEEIVDADKAGKIADLKNKEEEQQKAIADQLDKTLQSLLPGELASRLQKLEEKYGTGKPEMLEEFLRTQVTDEQVFSQVKTALESSRAAEDALAAKTSESLSSLVGDEEKLGALQNLFKQHETKLDAMEQLNLKRLKEVAGRNFEGLVSTLNEFDTRRAELERSTLDTTKSTLSTATMERIEAIRANAGQEKGLSVEEIQQVMSAGLPQALVEETIDQSMAQVSSVVGELLARHPDATMEDVFNSMERFLATEQEWEEEPPIEPTKEESQALENVEETDVLEDMDQGTDVDQDSGPDTQVVDELPVTPTLPVTTGDTATTTPEDKKATTDEVAEDKETPPLEDETSQAVDVPIGASKVLLDYAKDKITGISLGGVFENSAANTMVGRLKTNSNIEGDAYTFEFADPFGSAAGRFFISNDILYVKDGTLLNYEANTEHAITVQASNKANRTFNYDITVPVLDENEAPTDLAVKSISGGANPGVVENSANDTLVGIISSKDPDKKDSATYSLNDDAEGRFKLKGDQILVANSSGLNYEKNSFHNITIRVTDKGQLTYDEQFKILITDINEAPTDIILSNDTVNENSTAGEVFGFFTAVDEDFGDSATYALVEDASGFFAINGANLEVNQAVLNYESGDGGPPTYKVTVVATDKGGLTRSEVFVIQVADVNEVPTAIDLNMDAAHIPDGKLPENAPAGTVVGNLAITDPDNRGDCNYCTPADTFTYEIVSGSDSGADGKFTVDTDGNLLVAGSDALEYSSSRTNYLVKVKVTDHGEPEPLNLTREEEVTVNMRPFDCKYIPDTPTVSTMQSNGRSTYATLYAALGNAADGATVSLTEAQLEELIVGKIGQQLTSFTLTSGLSKFDVRIFPTIVDTYFEAKLGDGLKTWIANSSAATHSGGAAAWSTLEGVFDTFGTYASDYKTCVRIRIKPEITAEHITYYDAWSVVDVHHDVDLIPDMQFSLKNLIVGTSTITGYNTFITPTGAMSLANWRFFTTVNSRVPYHVLVNEVFGGDAEKASSIERKIEATLTATSGRAPTAVVDGRHDPSQAIPTTQYFDYYFPGLVNGVSLGTGVITLTR